MMLIVIPADHHLFVESHPIMSRQKNRKIRMRRKYHFVVVMSRSSSNRSIVVMASVRRYVAAMAMARRP